MLGGDDRSEVHDAALAFLDANRATLALREEVSTFKYQGGKDLSGYEDGTENPTGDRAMEAAVVSGAGRGRDGASFVAAQRYLHDLDAFSRKTAEARDLVIGRRRADNEEIADAPPSAHVKRAAQESFDPPAFMVRRSMPWGGAREHGLYFVAYGRTLDAFERVLRRMAGEEDGVVDALLTFSRAASGGYYWCPPLVRGAELDLTALLPVPE
jgi:putative iron-dependent peroxidase